MRIEYERWKYYTSDAESLHGICCLFEITDGGDSAKKEIIEDRHGKSSLVIISQVPVNKWYDIIGEQTIADAILDRIVQDAHRIELQGESLRKSKNSKQEND